jgi:hypothetical protein
MRPNQISRLAEFSASSILCSHTFASCSLESDNYLNESKMKFSIILFLVVALGSSDMLVSSQNNNDEHSPANEVKNAAEQEGNLRGSLERDLKRGRRRRNGRNKKRIRLVSLLTPPQRSIWWTVFRSAALLILVILLIRSATLLILLIRSATLLILVILLIRSATLLILVSRLLPFPFPTATATATAILERSKNGGKGTSLFIVNSEAKLPKEDCNGVISFDEDVWKAQQR